MGKRSQESQRERRRYKKRSKHKDVTENEPIPMLTSASNLKSSVFPNASAALLPPGPRGPCSLASDCDVPSPLYSQGASLSELPWGHSNLDTTETRERYTDEEDTGPGLQHIPRTQDERTLQVTASLMKELNKTREELPVIVHENKRKLQVLITDPEVANFQGSDVLKLSMEEYVERLHTKERKSKRVIKCLRDHVEVLQTEVNDVKQSSRIEKVRAVLEVKKIWRDSILEGTSYGGKMVNAAMQKKRK